MLKDLGYAYRTLRQSPVFSITAILSIALAIGANSAIFSFQDALLFRPLAIRSPSTLVSLNSRTPTGAYEGFAYPDFIELRDKNRSFDALVGYRYLPAGIAKDENSPLQFRVGLLVSGNFFEALGVHPYRGRGFREDEDQVPGRDPVVVLAYEYWQNEFAADPSIVGRHIRLGRAGGLDFTVIGVAPESFTGMDQLLRPEFYIPVMMGPAVLGAAELQLTERQNMPREDYFSVKGRLRSGVSIQTANADVAAIAKTLEGLFPNTNRGRGAAVRTEIQSRLDASPIIAGIVAAVTGVMVVILLIACANVMNLVLGRGRARAREVAIRLSLGASRSQLIRQLMAESLLIAVTGGALGLLIAEGAVQVFSDWEFPGDVPAKFAFQLDTRVLLFTLVVSFLSAIIFGLVPAFRATRTDLNSTLKVGELNGGRKRFFARNILVTVQIAGSIVLVMAAAQMYRNTTRALTENLGIAIDHRLTVRLDPSVAGYNPTQIEQYFKTLVDRAVEQPGVKSAALAVGLPFTTEALVGRVTPEGYESSGSQKGVAVRGDIVDEHYFQTFGVPMLRGRGFMSTDQATSPKVAVVNEEFAKRYFKGDPIGKHAVLHSEPEITVEVVGMTSTGKYQSVAEPPSPTIYLPFSQHPRQRMTLIVETAGDPAAMAAPLRELFRSIDRNVPMFSFRTMEDLFESNAVAQIRVFNIVFSSTGLMGFSLAIVGLYAVVAYQVTRRTREIGIRMALGAERSEVMRMMVNRAGVVAGTGIIIGLALSVAVRPALLTSLGRPTSGGPLSGFDPLLFVLLPLTLMFVTLFAAAIPARRASRIDPQRALRSE